MDSFFEAIQVIGVLIIIGAILIAIPIVGVILAGCVAVVIAFLIIKDAIFDSK